jgi:polyphosphate kinase
VTRDADVEVEEDEAEDLLQAIESVLWRRRRAASPVRLEIDGAMSSEVLELLGRELDLEPSDVYVSRGLLDLAGMWAIYGLDRPDLKEEPWTPLTHRGSVEEGNRLFRYCARRHLVHHPTIFVTSVEAFLEQVPRPRRPATQTLY